jgi:hypothetical protein
MAKKLTHDMIIIGCDIAVCKRCGKEVYADVYKSIQQNICEVKRVNKLKCLGKKAK